MMREIKFRAFDRKTELFGAVIELSYSPNSNSVYVPSYVRVHDYKDVTHVAHYPEPHCIHFSSSHPPRESNDLTAPI